MLIHRAAALNNLSDARPGIVHGFFGREGGISSGLYESLNCGPGSRDDPAHVAENRARAVKALSPGARLATLAQIHSAQVHTVDKAWDFAARPDGDGLVTALPHVALGILTADCGPVLFADARARVIGAAHAGWKGDVGGVLEATLAAMERLGARIADVTAAIGPTISRANYEVGEDLRARFDAGDARFFTPGNSGHYHFDLPGYIGQRLTRAGVGAVTDIGLCTYPPQNGFFSFRRATHRSEADYGRELSAIALL
jgi:YfiH family protein